MAYISALSGRMGMALNNGDILYGAGGTGAERAIIRSGVYDIVVKQTIERVDFALSMDQYRFSYIGNSLSVCDTSNTLISTITVQAKGTTLAFLDGSVTAKTSRVGEYKMLVADTGLTANAGPISIVPPAGEMDTSQDALSWFAPGSEAPQPNTSGLAYISLHSNEQGIALNNYDILYGAGGTGIERAIIPADVRHVVVKQTIERVDFAADMDQYLFKYSGNNLSVYDTSNTLISTITVQAKGTTLAFLDGSVTAKTSRVGEYKMLVADTGLTADADPIHIAPAPEKMDASPDALSSANDYMAGGALPITLNSAEDVAFVTANQTDFDSKTTFYRDIYFDEDIYCANKADYLNTSSGTNDWTAQSVKATFATEQDAWQDFCSWGAFVSHADGTRGINPSQYFDVDSYLQDKLAICKEESASNINMNALISQFKTESLDPITDFALYGYRDAISPVMTDNTYNVVSAETTMNSNSKSVPLSGDTTIDALVSTETINWNLVDYYRTESSNTLYYAFPDTYTELASLASKAIPNTVNAQNFVAPIPDTVNAQNFVALNSTQQTHCLSAFDYISEITGINFVQADTRDAVDLLLYEGGMPNANTQAFTQLYYYASNAVYSGQAQLVLGSLPATDTLEKGSDGYQGLLHELGHVLGLKHSFEGDHGNNNILTTDDSCPYTIMSYKDTDTWYAATQSNATYSPYDLMALNYLYGEDGFNGTEGLVYY